MFQLPELVLFGLLSLVVIMPVWWAWRFALLYLRCKPSLYPPDPKLPRVAVLLALRGVDPFLGTCLRGLLRQNYPNYCIHLVVDSPADPANELVASILNEGCPDGVKVCISVLREPLPNCSFKVSAHIQALTEIDANIEVIALIDADAAPSANWLRALVEPLGDSEPARAEFLSDGERIEMTQGPFFAGRSREHDEGRIMIRTPSPLTLAHFWPTGEFSCPPADPRFPDRLVSRPRPTLQHSRAQLATRKTRRGECL